ncbi:DUF2848 family protein [Georgenia wangjunii]|uniref:DUF2848 family protein n=1 Tax=Georgenia wangjunii TaxID=3117730 RepID=UPI002F25F64B
MEHVELDRARLQSASTRVVVAGYTARDEAQVRHHIEELARIGVAPPANVPEYYPMPPGSVVFGDEVVVEGERTSGEVEPVLVRLDGEIYLAVGSDHTDREHEAVSVAESKARCPKPLSTSALRLAPGELDEVWDVVELVATVDGAAYQAGSAHALRPLTETLRLLEERTGLSPHEDLVLFGGTVALVSGEFVYGERWHLGLRTPDQTLTLDYRTVVRTTEGATSAQG